MSLFVLLCIVCCVMCILSGRGWSEIEMMCMRGEGVRCLCDMMSLVNDTVSAEFENL